MSLEPTPPHKGKEHPGKESPCTGLGATILCPPVLQHFHLTLLPGSGGKQMEKGDTGPEEEGAAVRAGLQRPQKAFSRALGPGSARGLLSRCS